MTIPIQYNATGDANEGTAPLVVIGPNGSGKTRFALQIAKDVGDILY